MRGLRFFRFPMFCVMFEWTGMTSTEISTAYKECGSGLCASALMRPLLPSLPLFSELFLPPPLIDKIKIRFPFTHKSVPLIFFHSHLCFSHFSEGKKNKIHDRHRERQATTQSDRLSPIKQQNVSSSLSLFLLP